MLEAEPQASVCFQPRSRPAWKVEAWRASCVPSMSRKPGVLTGERGGMMDLSKVWGGEGKVESAVSALVKRQEVTP